MSRSSQPRPLSRGRVHPVTLPPLVQSPLVNERLRENEEEEKQVHPTHLLLRSQIVDQNLFSISDPITKLGCVYYQKSSAFQIQNN